MRIGRGGAPMDEKTALQIFVLGGVRLPRRWQEPAAELSADEPVGPYADLWKNARCAMCGEPFDTESEWENRHMSGADDFHPDCCPECMRDGHSVLYRIILDSLERAMGIMTVAQQAEWDADGLL